MTNFTNNSVDPTIARGMARESGKNIARLGDRARENSFYFALMLMRRNELGWKLDGPVFNVALSKVVKNAQENAATLRFDSEKLRLGQNGLFHRQSLQIEEIKHFRGLNQNYSEKEWVVAVDHISVQKGWMKGLFWTPSILFGNHIVTRYLERGSISIDKTNQTTVSAELSKPYLIGSNTQKISERIAALVDSGLPLAALFRACSISPKGDRFFSFDIALPAPGGVLCGGTEMIQSRPIGDKFLIGKKDSQWGIHSTTDPFSLHMTASLRTYMDNNYLDRAQLNILDEIRQWSQTHEQSIRQDPLGAYGWSDENGWKEIKSEIVESFRPLCMRVQENFSGWRRSLKKEGYYEIDFLKLAETYRVQENKSQFDQQNLADQMKLDHTSDYKFKK